MAYSDYGGFAYRNGALEIDRSDAVLSPDGIKSTPGAWPGWTLSEGRSGRSYHVLMGDGPIFVALYKQSSFHIFRLGEELSPIDLIVDPGDDDTVIYGDTVYVNTDAFDKRPCRLAIDGCEIEFYWRVEDNHYQYCRLKQPDGTIWTGWSGYGVGAGFDGGYGYSNDERNEVLRELFSGETSQSHAQPASPLNQENDRG